jgi:hypothetical protein
MKGQALILSSFVICLLIISLAFSFTRLQVFEIEENVDVNAIIYYFYSQSLAYATQSAINKYKDKMLEDKNATFQATSYAESLTYSYLLDSYNKAKKISPKLNLEEILNLNIKISSNGLRGNYSRFSILVQNRENILANLTALIIKTEITKINASINLYYRIFIYINNTNFINKDVILQDNKFNLFVFSYNRTAEFSISKENNIIILTVDMNYKNKLLILVRNNAGINLWLFA